MSGEKTLLSIMSERESATKFLRYIDASAVSDEAWVLLKDLLEYLTSNKNVQQVDWKDYYSWLVLTKKPLTNTKAELVKKLVHDVTTLQPEDVPDKHKADIVAKFVERDALSKIGEVAMLAEEGHSKYGLDTVRELYDTAHKQLKEVMGEESGFVDFTVDNLFNDVELKGYDYPLECLNKSLGKLRPGQLLCLAGRPEVGKTTLFGQIVTHVAKQLVDNQKALVINNEESVRRRVMQCALQIPSAMMETQYGVENMRKYTELMNGDPNRIMLYDIASISTLAVEEIILSRKGKNQFALIVLNQLYKMHHHFGKAEGPDKLQRLYQWARELGKTHGAAVIAVHQLGEPINKSEYNYKYPGLSELYGSKTVIQGEADIMLHIGKVDNREELMYNRYFNFPKNKVEGIDPNYRYLKHEVMINPDTGMYFEPNR